MNYFAFVLLIGAAPALAVEMPAFQDLRQTAGPVTPRAVPDLGRLAERAAVWVSSAAYDSITCSWHQPGWPYMHVHISKKQGDPVAVATLAQGVGKDRQIHARSLASWTQSPRDVFMRVKVRSVDPGWSFEVDVHGSMSGVYTGKLPLAGSPDGSVSMVCTKGSYSPW